MVNKMSRVVHVAGRMVELSGLHGIWRGTDHLCNSRITLFYPKGPCFLGAGVAGTTQTIEYAYGKWAEAEKDVLTLEEAKKEFERALSHKILH
jgi:hypothetical protein